MTTTVRSALVVVVLLSIATCSAPDGPSGSPGLPDASATSNPPSAVASAAVTDAPATDGPVALLGPPPTDALDAATSARLQSALDAIVAAGAPDVIAAVMTHDGTWTGAAGVVGPDGSPASLDDVFAVASVTKSVVAALMLRLEELGEFDLDVPMSEYIGDLDVDTNGATVRQALAMRGGFGETDGDVVDEALADCTRAWTRDEVLAAFPEPVAMAGATFDYSNPGYKLVGYVAEAVTGLPLAEAIRTHVVAPAGVERLVYQGPDATTPGRWALPIEGHEGKLALADYGVGGTLPCLSDSTLSVAGTAMASDASSLARWAWALFSGTIIDQASLAEMTTIDADSYGLGIWRLHDFRPDVAFGHAGNKPGFAPLFAVLPERQIVVVVCINDGDADPYGPARRLLEALAP